MSAPAAKTVTRTPFKKWCDENVGLLFLIPWIIGFVVFKLYPFATSLFYSFTDMNFFDGITKYGLMNYIYIFTNKKTLTSFIITFRYALITVPLKLIFALFIAYILNFKIKCVNLFRTIYYIPSILGGSVAIAVLWKALFKEDGIINMLLSFIGIQGPSWLADPDYAMVVIIVLRVWQFGSAMVLLSSTTSLPRSLRRSRNSTVPTLSLIMAAPAVPSRWFRCWFTTMRSRATKWVWPAPWPGSCSSSSPCSLSSHLAARSIGSTMLTD